MGRWVCAKYGIVLSLQLCCSQENGDREGNVLNEEENLSINKLQITVESNTLLTSYSNIIKNINKYILKKRRGVRNYSKIT